MATIRNETAASAKTSLDIGRLLLMRGRTIRPDLFFAAPFPQGGCPVGAGLIRDQRSIDGPPADRAGNPLAVLGHQIAPAAPWPLHAPVTDLSVSGLSAYAANTSAIGTGIFSARRSPMARTMTAGASRSGSSAAFVMMHFPSLSTVA